MKIIERGKGWADCSEVKWVRTDDGRLMTEARWNELNSPFQHYGSGVKELRELQDKHNTQMAGLPQASQEMGTWD